MNHVTPFQFWWHHQFFIRNQQIFLYSFNKDDYNFDDAGKNGYSRSSLNKGIFIIFFFYVTNKVLSYVSNSIAGEITWLTFGNSSISMKELIITSILLEFDQKNYFFEGRSWFKLNNLWLALAMLNFTPVSQKS